MPGFQGNFGAFEMNFFFCPASGSDILEEKNFFQGQGFIIYIIQNCKGHVCVTNLKQADVKSNGVL